MFFLKSQNILEKTHTEGIFVVCKFEDAFSKDNVRNFHKDWFQENMLLRLLLLFLQRVFSLSKLSTWNIKNDWL